MKVILRFYRQHDLDLISLHKTNGFSITTAIKKSLNAYVNHQTLCIQAPSANKLDYKSIPKQIQLILTLDDELDKKEIDWIKSLRIGMRNSAIKNLLRGYLSYPIMSAYLANDDFSNEILNEKAFKENYKSITEISLRYRKNKKNNKKNNISKLTKVEDSNLAKAILSVPTLKSLKNDVVFVDNIEEKSSENKKENNNNEYFDLFDDIDAMMQSM